MRVPFQWHMAGILLIEGGIYVVMYHVAHELWMLLGVVPGLCHHWLSVLARVVHSLQPVVWKMLAAAPVVHGGKKGHTNH